MARDACGSTTEVPAVGRERQLHSSNLHEFLARIITSWTVSSTGSLTIGWAACDFRYRARRAPPQGLRATAAQGKNPTRCLSSCRRSTVVRGWANCTLPIYQHGDLRVGKDFDCLAAEDNRRDPAT